MGILASSRNGRELPAASALSRINGRAGGAARWLALAVVTAAATWYGGGLAATPALADTTVTVTTTADEVNPGDGACSLREAILYAQRLNGTNADCGTTATGTTTINVPAGTYDVPAGWPAASHLEIGPGGPGPIAIDGASQTGTMIDAHSPYARPARVLLVDAGANVTLRNLTVQGGVLSGPGDGGGIENFGTLTLDHVAVTGNQTTAVLGAFPGQDRGGGIFNTGTLLLLNSDVSANSTAQGAGGGLFSSPICGSPGFAANPGAAGGGVYTQGGFVLALNTAIHGNATGAGGAGNQGLDARDASRQPCTFGGDGGPGRPGGDGGGIYNSDGIVTLRNSAVYGNATGAGGQGGTGGYGPRNGGNGGEAGQGGAGAGIASTGILTVVNTTITGNTTGGGGAGGTGGGSATAGGAGLPGGGGAGGIGGGSIVVNGQATVQESTIAQNLTGPGLGAGANAGPGRGSGIAVWAGTLTEIDTIVARNDCAVFAGQLKDGVAAGDGHLNLTWPAGTTCPGAVANPLLGPLSYYNGGPTPTMAVAPPSPAIDRIPPTIPAGCTPADQRGIPRPQPPGGRCDIGAYEYKP